MKSSLYIGRVFHQRNIPREHHFSYPFFMWFLNLDQLDQLPSLGRWFSTTQMALSRFSRPDYYGDPSVPLADAVRQRMQELTGKEVKGDVCGLMNMRTLGLYFSPVNFYYGYDSGGKVTHFLAEVSNIPWNERHQYAHYLPDTGYGPDNQKTFHVSPFNHCDQHYRWHLSPPEENVSVQIDVTDERGHIFTARVNLERHALERSTVRRELLKKPAMTAYIVSAIYWQAMKLFIKGVPYVPYTKESL